MKTGFRRQIAAGALELFREFSKNKAVVEGVHFTSHERPELIGRKALARALSDLAAMGVRRISVGGALARSAWGGFIRMAKEIAEQGSFAGFTDAASGAELNAFFTKDKAARD